MFHRGLGENTEFSGYHPLVNIIYFALVIGITVFSLSPWFLAATALFSWLYALLLRGARGLRPYLLLSLSVMVIMVLINTFFNHNGETVLFYINKNRITAEALCYGIASAVMLISVLMWFACFNVIVTPDKIIYIFSRTAPVLGLTLSMIFRFIPLLKSRFEEISMGQKCMGRSYNSGGPIKKARQLMKELSILIAWSLEASIESADSMEARGYGLRGRTSFRLFRFSGRDAAALALILASGLPAAAGAFRGFTNMLFYPRLALPELRAPAVVVLACYCVLAAAPLAIDIAGEIRWKRSDLKM